MPRIHPIRWPDALPETDRAVYARIWKRECRGDLWANDYSRGFAIRDGGRIVAVLVYVRVKDHRINFGRMTMRDYRGRGYALVLLAHLIKRFPHDTLECQNVNPKLTAGLERAGFTMVNESNRTFRLSRRR